MGLKLGNVDATKVMLGSQPVSVIYQGSNKVWELDTAMQATGGTITKSGGYTYHTFTSNGTFTVTKNPKAVNLLIVGGGGGGATVGGGGGGGGVREMTFPADLTSYAVTVGQGGAAGTASSNQEQGKNGAYSVFGSSVAYGGGGGGGGHTILDTSHSDGLDGGCGGGGAAWYKNGVGGNGSQGGNGGQGFNEPTGYPSAGGGGAGGNGSSASGSGGQYYIGGNGGPGKTWLNGVTYGGGGGGNSNRTAAQVSGSRAGYGGSGGGGNGGAARAGSNGSNGYGGGGGGGGEDYFAYREVDDTPYHDGSEASRLASTRSVFYSGGRGGSGVVIVRYLME